MTVQPSHDSPDSILRCIDIMMDELQALRQTVQSLLLRDAEIKGVYGQSNARLLLQRTVVDILANAPEQGLFQSAEAVDAYIAQAQGSWERL